MRVPVLLVLSTLAHADETNFLRDLALTRNFTLGRPVSAKPTPDGKSVLFLRAEPRSPVLSLFRFDVATAQTTTLATPEQILKGAEEQLSPVEKARRERQRVSTRGFTSFQLSEDGKLVLLSLSGKLYTLAVAGGAVTALPPTGAIDPQFSPDGKKLAYVRGRDLYVLDLASQKEKQLTKSSSPTVSNGVAEFVAQEEMSRYSGFWWSGDSKRLAYEEVEAKGVERLFFPDVAKPEVTPEAAHYPRAGRTNVQVRLGVISVGGGTTTWIPWDRTKFPYLTYVTWKGQGPLTFAVMNREQRDLQLWAWEQKPRLLLTEHDDAWLNIDPTLPRWLPKADAFVWSSERDGTPELELRDRSGKLVRKLSHSAPTHHSFVALTEREVFFLGSEVPTERHLYRVALSGTAAPVRTSEEPGLHRVTFGLDEKTWADTYVTDSALARTKVFTGSPESGIREVGELPSVAETPPFSSKIEFARVGSEGFYCGLIRPRTFDAKKKYPVVWQVYGGPHHNSVTRQPELLRQWIADRGFIVAACDGRGTPGRGRIWERHIVGDFSRTLDDQVTALRELGKKYPEMDLARVGVYGWSFGGWLSALAILRRPDVFKVAVAGAPVVDWRDYDTFYTERYIGLPDANRTGYEASSLLPSAKLLERPLLIVHGTGDDNVYFFNSLKLADALFRAGKKFEMLPLLGLTHMVPDPVVTENLYTRIASTLANALR